MMKLSELSNCTDARQVQNRPGIFGDKVLAKAWHSFTTFIENPTQESWLLISFLEASDLTYFVYDA